MSLCTCTCPCTCPYPCPGEPNIFLATGPTVLTDAFIECHHAHIGRKGTGGHGSNGPEAATAARLGAVYGSRTTTAWAERMDLFQRLPQLAHPEASDILKPVYDGYEYAPPTSPRAHMHLHRSCSCT